MSLLLWYPLTKDGRNQGIISNNFINGTFRDGGKLGKCLYTTSQHLTEVEVTEHWNPAKDDITLSCWLRFNREEVEAKINSLSPTSSATTPTGTIIGHNSYSGFAITWLANNTYSSGAFSALYLMVTARGKNSSGAAASHSTGQYAVPFDTWVHVAAVYDRTNNIINFYINGELFKTKTGIQSIVDITSGRKFAINKKEIYGGNGPSSTLPFEINDVRLYNHALQYREIQEISKGLLVHYAFDDPYIEATTNENNITGWSPYSSYFIINQRTSTGLIVQRPSTSTNTVLALQNSTLLGKMEVGDVWTFSGFLYVNGEPYKTSCQQISTYGYEETKVESRDDGYFRVTFTVTKKDAWIFHAPIFGSVGLEVSCEIRFMQFEKKDHPTGYANSGENRISYVGDNSGNGYNAETQNIIIETDTNKGTYSLRTKDRSDTASETAWVKTYFNSTITPTEFTISFFARANVWTPSRGDSLLNLSTSNSLPQDYLASTVAHYDSRLRLNSAADSTNVTLATSSIMPVGEWVHLAFVYDGATWTSFKNGVQQAQVAAPAVVDPFTTLWLSYGRAGGVTRNADINWADFKLYMTALTAEEIKKEATIAKRVLENGTIQAHTLATGAEKSCINYAGLQKMSSIHEVAVLEDGSHWIHVMHHNNKNGTNLFSSSDNFANDLVYHNSDCWSAFHLITNHGLYNNQYEFIAMNDFYDGTHQVQRWAQNTNPVVDTTTPTILSGTSSFSGLRKNGTNTFISRPSNWWAATGCWTKGTWGGVTGIPGYTDQTHACGESMDLYVRISPNDWKYKEFKHGIGMPTEIQLI